VENPFANFFGKKPAIEKTPPITKEGKVISFDDYDDLPEGVERVDGCDCEGSPCDCDLGVIEKRPGGLGNTATLGANAKKAEINQGYEKPSKEVKELRVSRIKFKKD